jgi:hypothetical protein
MIHSLLRVYLNLAKVLEAKGESEKAGILYQRIRRIDHYQRQ